MGKSLSSISLSKSELSDMLREELADRIKVPHEK
jgi:hypothetical protein